MKSRLYIAVYARNAVSLVRWKADVSLPEWEEKLNPDWHNSEMYSETWQAIRQARIWLVGMLRDDLGLGNEAVCELMSFTYNTCQNYYRYHLMANRKDEWYKRQFEALCDACHRRSLQQLTPSLSYVQAA